MKQQRRAVCDWCARTSDPCTGQEGGHTSDPCTGQEGGGTHKAELRRAQKLRHQDIPELTGKLQKLEAEAAQHLEASMAAQDDHRAAQEAQQVGHHREHAKTLASLCQDLATTGWGHPCCSSSGGGTAPDQSRCLISLSSTPLMNALVSDKPHHVLASLW